MRTIAIIGAGFSGAARELKRGTFTLAGFRNAALIPVERIARSIRLLRGQKVLLDAELAALYGVTTARLNQQVRRNTGRFPEAWNSALTCYWPCA